MICKDCNKSVAVDWQRCHACLAAHNRIVATHSVAIQRLIDEVRLEEGTQPNAYNRVYSRHNRS
jgi:hypothetical protein